MAHWRPTPGLKPAARPRTNALSKKLAELFNENFKKYEKGMDAEVKAASPLAYG